MRCPYCGSTNRRAAARFCPDCGRQLPQAPQLPQINASVQVQNVDGGEVVGAKIGQINGNLHVGAQTVVIQSPHGVVVHAAAASTPAPARPRPIPVKVLPQPFPGLLDRRVEAQAALARLQQAASVEFCGAPGAGKTALVRHLAHHAPAGFTDGVVYLPARPDAGDLLLDLFDEFYERDPAHKPTAGDLSHGLNGKKALVMLDDVALPPEAVDHIMNTASGCAFVLASTEQHIWGEQCDIALHGLPVADALTLVEHELGRTLDPAELPPFHALYQALAGHPLHLLQLAANVRDHDTSWEALAGNARPGDQRPLQAEIIAALPDRQRSILALLADLGNASLGVDHLAALTGVTPAGPELAALQQACLIQAHSPRYSLTGALAATIGEWWDLAPWSEHLLRYFTTWAAAATSVDDLMVEAGALLATLRRGAELRQWQAVLALGRPVEGVFALSARWGAWAEILDITGQAATALGDTAIYAWSLHQIGSRALCLGDHATARRHLSEALRLRETLGDHDGAAVTRHNLELLDPLPPPEPPRRPPTRGGTGGAITGLLLGLVLVGILVARGTIPLLPRATITVQNGATCLPLPAAPAPVPALAAAAGITHFDTLGTGRAGTVTAPAWFLSLIHIHRADHSLAVALPLGEFTLPIDSSVHDIQINGTSLGGEALALTDGNTIDIICP